jgi:SSS family solute:Na+ symporter
MALFIPFATARGTLIGGVGSLLMAVAVAFFKYMGIEVLFIMPAALLAGIVLGMVASFLDVYLLGNKETVSNRIHGIGKDGDQR